MLLERIFAFLSQSSASIYLVGGCLRQRLLDLPVNDYDFIVFQNAISLAESLAKRFNLPWFVLDQERDMARVVVDDIELDFSLMQGTDLVDDLLQRDITINAMAYPVDSAILSDTWVLDPALLIDPMGGFHDLQNGLIKGIRLQNFESDPLRLLRVFRFSVRLSFDIDKETFAWVESLHLRIQDPAKERLMHELFLILRCEHSAEICQRMNQAGLLSIILGLSHAHLDRLRLWVSLGGFIG